MTINYQQIQNLVAPELKQMHTKIQAQLASDVVLINQLGHYIVNGSGKLIRPTLTLLVAKALHMQSEDPRAVTAAAFIEFIHTATLLHDDVVDESQLRRGNPTANATFGNAASILVGDYIYTRAFQMMTELDSLPILKLMSHVTNVIAEGEVQQLMNCNDPNTTEQRYFEVIYSKTAQLFEAATQIPTILTHADHKIQQALAHYGRYLGTAFQLIDDLLDYSANHEQLGKNKGDDLSEGKPTLPLIHALAHGNKQEQQLITQVIEHGNDLNQAQGMQNFNAILTCMNRVGSLQYTKHKAAQEADKAVAQLIVLEDSIYKQALIELAYIATNRKM